MKKSDLVTGMRVRTRNNSIYLVVVDFLINGKKDILFAGEDGGWMNGAAYKDDLLMEKYSFSGISKGYDIMEIYSISENGSYHADLLNLSKRYSIWKREEYTAEQKETFKALKTLGFNWIARDDNENSLMAYNEKPTKWGGYWGVDVKNYVCDIAHDFDFIKWEDEEPFKIPEV